MVLDGSLGLNITFGILILAVLIMSAEKTVSSVLRILRHYGFSATFGGLTIFSITTSFPEIFAHLVASVGILRGTLDYKVSSATVLGANIGSDVIQQTLILGIVILLMGGLVFKRKFLKTAYLPMIGTTLLTLILGWDGTLSRIDGAILLITFVAYMRFLYKQELNNHLKSEKSTNITKDIIMALVGMVALLFSAHFLLLTSEKIVALTGLGGSLIGVVSLGVASAAPELFTAIYGLKKKAVGISLGTLIGSNITNPLVAIGGGALISTYWVPKALVFWDLPMETITASLLLLYLWHSKGKLGRGGAIYLIGLYAAYLAIRIIFFAVD